MSRIKKIAVACFLMIMGACFFAPRNVWADMNYGGAPGANGGGCYSDAPYSWWDTCTGVAWRYYPADSDSITMPGNSVTPGATVTGCKKMGGFYYLGFEVFSNGSFEGRQMGGAEPRMVVRPYGQGSYVYAGTPPGAIPWEKVQNAFEIAKSENPGINPDWNTTAWFCFDSDWLDDETDSGRFTSRTVAIVPDADGPTQVDLDMNGNSSNGHMGYKTSSNKVNSRIELSTDREDTRVIFRHRLNYNDALYDSHPDTSGVSHLRNVDYSAVNNDICTDWEVEYTVGGEKQALPADQTGSGRLCTNNKADNKDKLVSETKSIIVHLEPGQTSTVCQRINYKPAKYTVTWERHDESKNEGTSGRPNWVTYTDFTSKVEGTGRGRSRNCVRITRPKDPEPENGSDIVTTQGSTDGTVMYAGEGAVVSWASKAKSIATRRLNKFQAILYQVPVDQDYNSDSVKEWARHSANISNNLCNYPGKHALATVGCNQLETKDISSGTEVKTYTGEPYKRNVNIVVSDRVGDKYCNTVGYKYEYWYNYRIGGEDDWHYEDGRDYWFIAKPACRTVAKKPNLAVWNGNLYSNGDIQALSAERYRDTALAKATVTDKSANPTTLYGSWSEHLAVANKRAEKFGSGASLATGSSAVNDFLQNSTLTIANNVDKEEDLGYAGIEVSTVKEQLWQRLKDHVTTELSGDWGGEVVPATSTETKIYHADTLNLLGNIENRNTYNSINDIPQVIIFANNVNIASNVTRIDAWIIADGTIDTCAKTSLSGGFQNGGGSLSTGNLVIGTAASTKNGAANQECAKQLIFNGPVIADTIKLNRSYGAEVNSDIGTNFTGANNDNSKQQPAEIFNYRADAYLWSYAQSGKFGSNLNEVYIKELPPRY